MSERSAARTIVSDAAASLSVASGSGVAAETVARVDELPPGAAAAATTSTETVTEAPGSIVPSAQLTVPVQAPPGHSAATSSSRASSGSSTTTSVAADGPSFVTVRLNVEVWPASTVGGDAVFAIERSACSSSMAAPAKLARTSRIATARMAPAVSALPRLAR